MPAFHGRPVGPGSNRELWFWIAVYFVVMGMLALGVRLLGG